MNMKISSLKSNENIHKKDSGTDKFIWYLFS